MKKICLTIIIILTLSNVAVASSNYLLNSITAQAAATDLSAAYTFPNPFNTASGHTNVTFTNLASTCTIRIFNSSGELVSTIQESSGSGETTWDVTNSFNRIVRSGTYLYLIESAADRKVGKLIIIR